MAAVIVWADSLFQFYSVKPIIQELQKRNIEVKIYSQKENQLILSKYLNIPLENVFDPREELRIGGLGSKLLRIYERFFEEFCMSPKFSVMYKRIRNGSDKFSFISKFFPRKKSNINTFYEKFLSPFSKSRFSKDVVLVVTLTGFPYLIANRKIKKVTIMESWDHPVKMPFYHVPKRTYTWNADLKKDISEYQEIKNIELIFPLKFRYVVEFAQSEENLLFSQLKSKKYIDDLKEVNAQTMMYIVSTSARNPKGFEGEMDLVRQLVNYTAEHGIHLYIKPKPNGLDGEFDEFKSFKNVQIGIYGKGEQSEDMLDDEYHLYRYLLLKKCGLVVNVFTTFVLEAVILKKPVLQFTIKGVNSLFAEYTNNPHLKNYLLCHPEVRAWDGTDESMKNIMDEAIHSKITNEYSERIRKWILSGDSLELSINKITNELEDQLTQSKV